MKYEISQGQYATFLNHLTPDEAVVRYPPYLSSYRYTISGTSSGYVASATNTACNYLSVSDFTAYLDWAALRPMTDLEYEKICRGPLAPEPNEYPWGSTTIQRLTSLTGVEGGGTETALPSDANCQFGNSSSGIQGPVRVGIFAQPGSSRLKSGASYYGVMDMGGNVREFAVSAGLSAARSFDHTHGDGSIMTVPATWPAYVGFCSRGGGWNDLSESMRTSDRYGYVSSARDRTYGGRGVRTAP